MRKILKISFWPPKIFRSRNAYGRTYGRSSSRNAYAVLQCHTNKGREQIWVHDAYVLRRAQECVRRPPPLQRISGYTVYRVIMQSDSATREREDARLRNRCWSVFERETGNGIGNGRDRRGWRDAHVSDGSRVCKCRGRSTAKVHTQIKN